MVDTVAVTQHKQTGLKEKHPRANTPERVGPKLNKEREGERIHAFIYGLIYVRQ